MTGLALDPSLAGLRVLLADDDAFNHELFVVLMSGQGLEITHVSSGREAVRAGESSSFDIVLMDVQMSGMDGLEASRELRRLGFADLPIIALTAEADPSHIERCLAAGMTDHLAKPYTPAAALMMMARWSCGALGGCAASPTPERSRPELTRPTASWSRPHPSLGS